MANGMKDINIGLMVLAAAYSILRPGQVAELKKAKGNRAADCLRRRCAFANRWNSSLGL
jgi:hypothetical protein